jgi:hypothetical protein
VLREWNGHDLTEAEAAQADAELSRRLAKAGIQWRPPGD